MDPGQGHQGKGACGQTLASGFSLHTQSPGLRSKAQSREPSTPSPFQHSLSARPARPGKWPALESPKVNGFWACSEFGIPSLVF